MRNVILHSSSPPVSLLPSHLSSTAERITSYLNEHPSEQDISALSVVDLAELLNIATVWASQFADFTPYFDYQSSQDPAILRLLAQCGVKFRVYTRADVANLIGLGIATKNMFLANPCKMKSHIAYSAANGLQLMSADSLPELEKLSMAAPHAKVMLMIQAPRSNATELGSSYEDWRSFFEVAKKLNLSVVGVTVALNASADMADVVLAIQAAKRAFDVARDCGTVLSVLDLGSLAFAQSMCPQTGSLEQMMLTLRTAITLSFSTSHVRLMCDPSSIFVGSACAVATRVQSCAEVFNMDLGTLGVQYELNESSCSNLSTRQICGLLSEDPLTGQIVCKSPTDLQPAFFCGPDLEDTSLEPLSLPQLLVGDWIVWAGAATSALSAQANGLELPPSVYFLGEEELCVIDQLAQEKQSRRHRSCSQCCDEDEMAVHKTTCQPLST